MNKRLIAFIAGLIFFLALLTQGTVVKKQYHETETNGSFLCFYCVGIG